RPRLDSHLAGLVNSDTAVLGWSAERRALALRVARRFGPIRTSSTVCKPSSPRPAGTPDCQKPGRHDRRAGIDQRETCRREAGHPQDDARPANALAEGAVFEHRRAERHEAGGHEDNPSGKQRLKDSLIRLPDEYEGRLVLRGGAGGVIEVGEAGGRGKPQGARPPHREAPHTHPPTPPGGAAACLASHPTP